MKVIFGLAFLLLTFITIAQAQDPVVTDPDKYSVILENERVRVLEYKDKPGEKTHMHWDPDFLLYALSDFQRTLHFPDGKTKTREFNKGDVIWM